MPATLYGQLTNAMCLNHPIEPGPTANSPSSNRCAAAPLPFGAVRRTNIELRTSPVELVVMMADTTETSRRASAEHTDL